MSLVPTSLGTYNGTGRLAATILHKICDNPEISVGLVRENLNNKFIAIRIINYVRDHKDELTKCVNGFLDTWREYTKSNNLSSYSNKDVLEYFVNGLKSIYGKQGGRRRTRHRSRRHRSRRHHSRRHRSSRR
jgi:hypothetical protein